MRCLVTFWRAQGIKISVFIDDELGSADKVQSNIHSLVVTKSLTEAGFVINTQKSIWQPQRELIWLGVNINLDKLCFSIPQTRMKSISFSLEKIIKNLTHTTARKLAKVCGKLISTKFVMGNIVQLKQGIFTTLLEQDIPGIIEFLSGRMMVPLTISISGG